MSGRSSSLTLTLFLILVSLGGLIAEATNYNAWSSGTRLYIYLHGDGVNTVYVEVTDSSGSVVYSANYPANVNQTIYLDVAPGSYTVDIIHVDPQTGASTLYTTLTVTVQSESGLIDSLVSRLFGFAESLMKSILPASVVDFISSLVSFVSAFLGALLTVFTATLKLLAPMVILGWAAAFIANPISTIEITFDYIRRIVQLIANIINTLIPI